MHNPYVVGKHCYLRHPTQEDADGAWHEWFSDEETTRYLNSRYWPNSLESQKAFYQTILQVGNRLVLSIVDVESDKHIGVCNLSNINWVHRYSEMALIIGKKDFRAGPYAVEATSLLLRIAFQRLNLRMVKSDYVETNTSSEIIHRLFRFEKTGQVDDIFWDEGSYVPIVQMVLRKKVWQRRRSKKITETDKDS
jgi:RimJ/RimL family protein N-acetyltransferase